MLQTDLCKDVRTTVADFLKSIRVRFVSLQPDVSWSGFRDASGGGLSAFSFSVELISAIGNLFFQKKKKKKMEIVDTFEEAEFPPVLSRAIKIKDVSLFEGVAQCRI